MPLTTIHDTEKSVKCPFFSTNAKRDSIRFGVCDADIISTVPGLLISCPCKYFRDEVLPARLQIAKIFRYYSMFESVLDHIDKTGGI